MKAIKQFVENEQQCEDIHLGRKESCQWELLEEM